jgi:hypothetical protein
MVHVPHPKGIWALLHEHGLLPEMHDRSVRGGSHAVSFEEIVLRVRDNPDFPLTGDEVDRALTQELWDGPPNGEVGRITL